MKDVLTCAVAINKYNCYSFAKVNKCTLCKSFRNKQQQRKKQKLHKFSMVKLVRKHKINKKGGFFNHG